MRQITQRSGVALISALLTVAVATAASASLAVASRIWLRQAESSIDRAQADTFVAGALDWACETLTAKARRGGADSLGEAWANPIGPIEIGPGRMRLTITDAQSLFNLNSLGRAGVRSEGDIATFRRLLLALRLDVRLADAATVRVLSAAPLDVPDDLLAVYGATPAVIERLRPWVTALPEATAININTAARELIHAAAPGLDDDAVTRLLARRLDKPLEDMPDGTDAGLLLGVGSSYFFVRAVGESGRIQIVARALVRRPINGQAAYVVWRSDER